MLLPRLRPRLLPRLAFRWSGPLLPELGEAAPLQELPSRALQEEPTRALLERCARALLERCAWALPPSAEEAAAAMLPTAAAGTALLAESPRGVVRPDPAEPLLNLRRGEAPLDEEGGGVCGGCGNTPPPHGPMTSLVSGSSGEALLLQAHPRSVPRASASQPGNLGGRCCRLV